MSSVAVDGSNSTWNIGSDGLNSALAVGGAGLLEFTDGAAVNVFNGGGASSSDPGAVTIAATQSTPSVRSTAPARP